MLFISIILASLAFELLFWRWADHRFRPLKRAKLWRTLLACFMTFQLVGHISILLQRSPLHLIANYPTSVLATVYLWHLLVLPLTIVAITLIYSIGFIIRQFRKPPPSSILHPPSSPSPTRRQLLAASAAALPPLLTGVSLAAAMSQLGNFRIREIEIPLADLPPSLDGLTIAHVSDTHVGRFLDGKHLLAVAEATNSLKADLVLLTGDLIDYSLTDLPAALDMVRRIDPRQGLYICQGNHDMFESREKFDQRVRAAGYNLLVDDSARVAIRGTPIQLLGLRWGKREDGKDAGVYNLVPRLAALRQPDAFPILLAHHPHAFDPARDCNLPLTLAGHTHGGQLMLTPTLGPGPLFYRYYSGLYKIGRHACVVSNGVGNWFPLRINAPAEILKITLRHQA